MHSMFRFADRNESCRFCSLDSDPVLGLQVSLLLGERWCAEPSQLQHRRTTWENADFLQMESRKISCVGLNTALFY